MQLRLWVPFSSHTLTNPPQLPYLPQVVLAQIVSLVPLVTFVHAEVDEAGWHDWHVFPGLVAPLEYRVPEIQQPVTQPAFPSQIFALPQLVPPASLGCVHAPPLHRSDVHDEPSSVQLLPSVVRVQPAVSVCVGAVQVPALHT